MKNTIRSSREIDDLFRDGTRSAAGAVVVLVRSSERCGAEGRVAFLAGKRVGGAVARNRAKRVLRAAVARAGGPWRGWDVAFIARPGAGYAVPAEIDRDVDRALRKAGVIA